MKRLVFQDLAEESFPEDVDRMVQICRDRGFFVSRHDVRRAWEEYSYKLCAGWMILGGNDDSIFRCLRRFLKEEE